MPRTLERLRTDAVRLSEELREDTARLLALRRDSPDAELHVRLQCEYSGTDLQRLQALEQRFPTTGRLPMLLAMTKRSVKTRNYPTPIQAEQMRRMFPGDYNDYALELQQTATGLGEILALASWQVARENPERWSGCGVHDFADHQRQIAALEQSCTVKRDELQAIRAEVQGMLDSIRDVLTDVDAAMVR